MNAEQPMCTASDKWDDCYDEPVITRPIALCRKHLAAVAHRAAELFIAQEARPVQLAEDDTNIIKEAGAMNIKAALVGPHRDAVYFLANGSRIKIGYTTNLKTRVGALSLRESDVLLLLAGGHNLERALHRRFNRERVQNTEWFELSPRLRRFLSLNAGVLPRPIETKSSKPRPRDMPEQRFPDGKLVGPDQFPHLWQAFEAMGNATKRELQEVGVVASLDTVGRAMRIWLHHGVQSRKEGRAERFFLPGNEEEAA